VQLPFGEPGQLIGRLDALINSTGNTEQIYVRRTRRGTIAQ
jgi:hypothetical protein